MVDVSQKSEPESFFWRTSVTKVERMSGVIREVQSICLERDFLAGHFKENEAVTKRWSDVITDVLSVLYSEVSSVFALCTHWQPAGHGAQQRIGAS